MIRNSLLLAGFASLAITSAIASPKVGTYSGTADDGSFISMQVAKDGANFEFT